MFLYKSGDPQITTIMCAAPDPKDKKDHKPTRVRYKLAGGGPVNEESREKGVSKKDDPWLYARN